jgi:hypothetical protein
MMDNDNIFYAICAIILIILFYVVMTSREHFDAVGYVYNRPSAWFIKPAYDLNAWIVTAYPDQIQPECLPYNKQDKYGSLGDINYLSQAYRFWRF